MPGRHDPIPTRAHKKAPADIWLGLKGFISIRKLCSLPIFLSLMHKLKQMQETVINTLTEPGRYINNPASVILPEYLRQQVLAFSPKSLKIFKIQLIF